ncbi:MAG: glycosyltransferase family 2 protein [Hespellia sp.]|nr:glycosyltransferase family 2 protein [Hespellia sp.]
MSKDVISIIVPVFDVEKYIDPCIQSILRQSYQNLEILIMDDGSTDRSYEKCVRYAEQDGRIRLMRQEHQGAAAARKNASRYATGKYMGFVDADDYVDEKMFELLINQMEGTDLVTSGFVKVDDDSPQFDLLPAGLYRSDEQMGYLIDNMIVMKNSAGQGLITNIWNKLFRLDLAKEVFSEINDQITFGEDCEFLYRYVLKCKSVRITDICCYHYRIREDSLIRRPNRRYLRNWSDMYDALEPLFMEHPHREALNLQLQRWIGLALIYAPRFMGFREEAIIDPHDLDVVYE